MGELSAVEAEQLKAMIAELHWYGYRDIPSVGWVRLGSRIRHSGQRWDDALFKGTGFVVALTQKHDSTWAREWGRPDVELIALWDKQAGNGSRFSQLAQYHVDVVAAEPLRVCTICDGLTARTCDSFSHLVRLTDDDHVASPEPCQPIGCDNGFHLEGCAYV